MAHIRRRWGGGFAVASGICLLLTGCRGSATTMGPAPSASSTARGTVASSPATAKSVSEGNPIATTIGLQDGDVYGVGMPITVDFSEPIPDSAKADVERGLSVRSEPAQVGAWRWYGDQEVIYRPRDFWRTGTRLTVSTTLGGVAVAGNHIDASRRAVATIGPKTTFQISDATKQMQVFQNDKLVKTFPVSLGAPDTPSSTGHMVIMTREAEALWVYSADDQLDVKYAERLTGDGEYIHAAPWSVADQGHDDVSHGCTNLSPDNAAWVYSNSKIGDPVTVSGTAKHLEPGNGWTVWDMSWAAYAKDSAIGQQAHPTQAKATQTHQ